MEARGLVRRESAEEDGRGAYVALTPVGLAALKATAPNHVASVRRHFIDLLTDDEIDTLATVSAKILAHLHSLED